MARTDIPPYSESDDPVSEQRFVGEAVAIKLRYRQALITLRAGTLYLGRSPECELAISDPAVSRRHARLWVSPTQIVVEDLGSQNGVYVNGQRIQGPCELEAGDRLRICSHELDLVNAFDEAEFEPNRYRITGDALSGAHQNALREELRPTSRPRHPVSVRTCAWTRPCPAPPCPPRRAQAAIRRGVTRWPKPSSLSTRPSARVT